MVIATFTRQHYNAIAKDIRELYAQTTGVDGGGAISEVARATLEMVAIKLAIRFEDDNDNFDPRGFLDACSPNPVRYPISKRWVERAYNEGVE